MRRDQWISILSLTLLFATLTCGEVCADVRLSRMFGDHMVLQRDRALNVWGWADPGEAVTVKLADKSATATADAKGRWRATLPPFPAGGPHELVVTGKNTVKLTDVLVGEVWVVSGQSNMAFPLQEAQRAASDVPQANHPKLRLFTVLMHRAARPRTDLEAPAGDPATKWTVCAPEHAKLFSAVGYYFGKEIQKDLDVPVGMIKASWGGTPIEPWITRDGYASIPSLKKYVDEIDKADADYRQSLTRELDKMPAWLEKARAAAAKKVDLPPLPSLTPEYASAERQPVVIYNYMIHPLTPFAIRGVLWFQGEANAGDGMLYYDKMKALIGGWRKAWGQGDFPFIYAELAPWTGFDDGALEGIWEAQLSTLSVPNTGMIVTTDLVHDVTEIHPPNKHDVGHRMALWALATVYGKSKLVYSGPLFKSASVEGNKMRVQFDHVGSGLTTRDGFGPDSFQVGSGGKFEPAHAKIDGDSILVWSDDVPQPQAVRFGWNKAARPNLINKEGLPASPFRSDPSPRN